MKNENEIKELLDHSKKKLITSIETYKSTLSKNDKRQLYNTIMHYDGRVYAYKEVLKLHETS